MAPNGLTFMEKEPFLRLFNRGGYVLDFSTERFDDFTQESVDIRLCEKYGSSKGRSLEILRLMPLLIKYGNCLPIY